MSVTLPRRTKTKSCTFDIYTVLIKNAEKNHGSLNGRI